MKLQLRNLTDTNREALSRSVEHPDDRGERFRYDGNSTVKVLENLSAIDSGQVAKIACFGMDARDIARCWFPLERGSSGVYWLILPGGTD